MEPFISVVVLILELAEAVVSPVVVAGPAVAADFQAAAPVGVGNEKD